MMRATIHLVSRRDYWPFVVGIRRGLQKWWLRTHGRDTSRREIAANDRKVRRALRGRTLSRAELEEVIGQRWAAAGVFVDLVRVPPSGTWERRRADLYALAEDWVGPEDASEDEGIEHLIRRYLQGFGPARPAEIADWAGLDCRTTRRALERLELRRFQDEQGKELVDLPRLPLPDAETPAPVRFLPVWDATLLVHARRTQILPEQLPGPRLQREDPQLREHVPRRRPGRRHVALRERARESPSRSAGSRRRLRAELDEEAERLAAFHS